MWCREQAGLGPWRRCLRMSSFPSTARGINLWTSQCEGVHIYLKIQWGGHQQQGVPGPSRRRLEGPGEAGSERNAGDTDLGWRNRYTKPKISFLKRASWDTNLVDWGSSTLGRIIQSQTARRLIGNALILSWENMLRRPTTTFRRHLTG